MKHLMAILLFIPATALAQDTVEPAGGPAAAEQARPQAPAAQQRAEPGGRRRPSMVGYIEDSSVETTVRVRFDAGYGTSAADRAEFFYAKCGCYRGLPASNAAFDPNAAGPGPGVVTNLNFGQLYIYGEFAPNPKFSVFADVPFRFLRPDTFAPGTGSFGPQNGISDVRFGAKASIASTAERQLTASLRIGAPTGDSLKGLGTNHATIEPVLLYQENPSDRLGVEAQFGGVIPTDGSAGVPTTSSKKFSGSVLYYGVGPSYEVYRNAQLSFAPIVELVGWHVLSGYQTADAANADGINIVNLKFGARMSFRDRSSIYVGYGRAVTTDDWYDNIVRFEYRTTFGR
jgi:hypothetical protein